MAVSAASPKADRPSVSPRVFWLRAAFVIAFLAGMNELLDHVARVNTRSIPYHFVWIVGGQPAKGDYAIVTLRHPAIAADGKEARITKRLVCEPGDYLRFDGAAWYCNGEKLGVPLTTTISGKPLEPFVYDGLVPVGQGFVMGTSPYSFDSRYLGFVPIEHMTKVRGLF